MIENKLVKEIAFVYVVEKIVSIGFLSRGIVGRYFQKSLARKYKRIETLQQEKQRMYSINLGIAELDTKELSVYFGLLTQSTNTNNSIFQNKLITLIESVIPYNYPDSKNDYIPDFSREVVVEDSKRKNIKNFCEAVDSIYKEVDMHGLEWTYSNLADEYSKEMMLRVIVYNFFKDVKIRFPLYYANIFPKLNDYEKTMRIDDEQINLWFDIIQLKKYDLKTLGYDLKIWFSIMGIFIDFINEQYRYKDIIKVEKGDVVIDGGACYGDTALYFAHNTKAKVFSFEFLDENIDIFNKNMDLNPKYKEYITLVTKPLAQISGEKLYAVSNGPGTSVTDEYKDGAQAFETISIDDFVEQNNIEKVDFIKLDVECSEAAVLKGAINTIRKFKPKLAICVYHKKDDLWTIPQLIKAILPEYKLYLDHHTINFTETLIYAKVQDED